MVSMVESMGGRGGLTALFRLVGRRSVAHRRRRAVAMGGDGSVDGLEPRWKWQQHAGPAARAFSATPARRCAQARQSLTAPQHARQPSRQPIVRHIACIDVLQVALSELTPTSCIVSSTDSIRDVGLQHESIRLVVTRCPLLPHISCLLSTLFHCPDRKDSALANHELVALLASATGPLCPAACLLRSGSIAILAEIRGHLPHAHALATPHPSLF